MREDLVDYQPWRLVPIIEKVKEMKEASREEIRGWSRDVSDARNSGFQCGPVASFA